MNKFGFTLVREEALSEVGGIARLWKHDKTGAELLSVCNGDENKCFGVNFRTPPKDSTGVAHILEHSVLCGSKKYPVKEPFVELLKSSHQTFLNALTFPDKTCYPVASCNLQDFYNLIDVYVDAVFYPRIDENVFRQEGWHIEAADTKGPWEYKGVVFNEMKGVYSSSDSVLAEQCQHAVFPDTLYGLDSGGAPEVIPTLTFEQFRNFHATYYHPTNARFYFWGDDSEDERLAYLEKILLPFEKKVLDSSIALQKPFDAPRVVRESYAVSEGEESKAHTAVNWLLCETCKTEEMFVLDMLGQILIGLPGSPLRKALMDSGLGEDLAGCGLESDLRQAYFSIGMRSVKPEDVEKVESVIMDCLKDLAEKGIAKQAVDAALNSLEFSLRENNTGGFPRGLAAMFSSLTEWLYDGDPFAPLAWEKPLASVKQRLASGEPVFTDAINTWFLQNAHRVRVDLFPDATLAERKQQEEDDAVEKIRRSMGEDERRAVVENTAMLLAKQQEQDSQEALATVPSLSIDDMEKENKEIPCTVEQDADIEVIMSDLDTTGILYAGMLFDLSAVPMQYFPYVPMYCRALTEMGTKRRDFVDLGFEISSVTGGIGAYSQVDTHSVKQTPLSFVGLSGKCTADKLEKMGSLLHEILFEPDFDNQQRFLQMAMEKKARMEQNLIPSGHSYVNQRLGAKLFHSQRMTEELSGTEQLFFMRRLCPMIQNEWGSVLEALEQIHKAVIRQNGMKLCLTASGDLLEAGKKMLLAIAAELPKADLPSCSLSFDGLPGNELLFVPSQVNYVGLGVSLAGTGYQYSGSLSVILRHLRMGYLWDKVRVQGGAYGCFARYGRISKAFTFASYRDPNVANTLKAYKDAADYLGNITLTSADITRAVVGAIGDMDTYMLPSAKGSAAATRWLIGETKEERRRIREEVLATTVGDFHAFAPFLAKALENPTVCVLGGNDASAIAEAENWNKTIVL